MRILSSLGNRRMSFALMFCVATAWLDSGSAMSQEVPSVSAQHLRVEPQGSERGVCRRDGGPACDPGLVCLSALCVFDDRRCGESASQASSPVGRVESGLPKLTAAIAARIIQTRRGYSDGGLVCGYQNTISASDGGKWTMYQSSLDDRDTRLCVDQLKAAGLLSIGACQHESGSECFKRYISPRGKAEMHDGYLSFPCGKVNFGEVISIRTLEGGRSASVKYSYLNEFSGLARLSQCNIITDGSSGMETVERMFVLDDAGVWMIQE
jgi:hypothetical protein